MLLTTTYTPPNDLPVISLTIKDGKLLALDWFYDKTINLLAKINQNAPIVAFDELGENTLSECIAKQTIKELDEYFSGTRQVFDVPLELSHGTEFQIKVWQTLCQIPYGQTISYKELADRVGQPSAYRACANANGKNLISLIVPCHRVIASDGTLGGYTGGLKIKKTLLALEKATCQRFVW